MTVAVGFSPRSGTTPARVAERRMKLHPTFQASLRDASSATDDPWTEGHGYRHPVALRPGVPGEPERSIAEVLELQGHGEIVGAHGGDDGL